MTLEELSLTMDKYIIKINEQTKRIQEIDKKIDYKVSLIKKVDLGNVPIEDYGKEPKGYDRNSWTGD